MKKLPPNYLRIEQHSAEWFQERLGRVTASRVSDALSLLKNGSSSQAREKYKMELVTEIITGSPVEHYVSPAMDWGVSNEPLARTAYEMETDADCERIGLVIHPEINRAAASPDGLVGDDGLVEIKCPTTMTHLSYLRDGIAPDQYIHQMMWQMACTGRKWCDFFSYDLRLPEDFRTFRIRVHRDDSFIGQMEKGVEQFIVELNALCEQLLKGRKAPKTDIQAAGPGPERAVIPGPYDLAQAPIT